jgi:hypothetical protein
MRFAHLFSGEAGIFVGKDGNYALYKPSTGRRAMVCCSALTAPKSRPKSSGEIVLLANSLLRPIDRSLSAGEG